MICGFGAALCYPKDDTTKARSGRVPTITYISFPINDRYHLTFSKSTVDSDVVGSDVAVAFERGISIGVDKPLQSWIPNDCSILVI